MAERPLKRQIANTTAASTAAQIFLRDRVSFSPMAGECSRAERSSHGAHARWFAENYCDRMAHDARMVRVRRRLDNCEVSGNFAAPRGAWNRSSDCAHIAAVPATAA